MDIQETKSKIWQELTTVVDPELRINLVDLGLIYGVELDEGGQAKIKMTLTSMSCPVGPMMQQAVGAAAGRVDGVSDVQVDVVWSPPWNPKEMASEDAQIEMGLI